MAHEAQTTLDDIEGLHLAHNGDGVVVLEGHRPSKGGHASHDEEHHGGHAEEGEGWLMSFADLVTNLLLFFIVMYAISSVDEQKFQKVAEAINGEEVKSKNVVVQAENEEENAEVIQQIQTLMEKLNPSITEASAQQKKDAAEIKAKLGEMFTMAPGKDPENDLFELVLGGQRFFARGSAQLSDEGAKALKIFVERLKPLGNNFSLQIEGHAAPEELTGDNPALQAWVLAGERAARVMLELRRARIQATQMTTAGFGAEIKGKEPVREGADAEAFPRARVHIRVVREVKEGR